jgi:hypothetical protein
MHSSDNQKGTDNLALRETQLMVPLPAPKHPTTSFTDQNNRCSTLCTEQPDTIPKYYT